MNKKIIILILAAISSLFLIPSQNNGSDFETWKKDFNIKFNEDEEVYRYGIFLSNLAKINEHNSKLGKTYTEGLTQFSALTPQEFAAQYLSSYVPSNNKIEIEEAE